MLRLRARWARFPLALFACLAFSSQPGDAAPRSVHPALRNVRPGEALSERFLTRNRRGEVLADVILQGNITPDLLRSRGIEVNSHIGDRITARVPLALLSTLLEIPGLERVRVAERCKPNLDVSALDVGLGTIRTSTPPTFTGQTGTGVLVGVVDTGIDYTNPDFQKPDGTTRLVSIWDQTAPGTPPAGFSFGTEWLPPQINAFIATEVDGDGHGSHVMGIAAGDGSNTGNGVPEFTYVGVAPTADLCMVKTLFSTASIVDGVNYIFQKAAALGKQAVVNLSLGTQEGPHDGTLDMDVMLNALTGPGKIIVASAGNTGADNMHGQVTLTTPGTPASMTLVVPAYTRNPGAANDFLIFSGWYSGSSQVSLRITTPTGIVIGPVLSGTNSIGNNTADGWLNIFNGTTSPTNGDNEIYIELYDANQNLQPKVGTWTFQFNAAAIGTSGQVDMYLYDSQLGSLGALAKWNVGLMFGGVIGSPGDADSIITVGAHTTKDCWDAVDSGSYCWNPHPTLNAIANFSSQGPRRDGVAKPDISAPGFGVTSTLSVDAFADVPLTATDGVHWILPGTSMSAPHVTGGTALLLARSEWTNATPSQIRARLKSTARADAFTGVVPNISWGAGKLDLGAALAAPMTCSVPHPAKGELYAAGKYDSVDVTVTGFTADTVNVALSLDGGGSYPLTLGSLFNVAPGTHRALIYFVDPSMMTTQAKVRAVAINGATVLTSFSDSLFVIAIPSAVQAGTSTPARFALWPNAPNPFNPVTTIHFELDRPGSATLRIYSVTGALVRTLVEKQLPAGRHQARWDGRDSSGRPASSGVYVYRLTEGGRDLSRKMSLLK